MAEAPIGFEGIERPPGASWWKADDGRWYPPESRPGFRAPVAPRVEPGSGTSSAATALGLLAAVAGLFAIGIAFVVPGLAFGAGGAALLFGVAAHVVARRRNSRPRWATIGMGLGVIGAIVGLSLGTMLQWSDEQAQQPDSAAREQECVVERFILDQVSERYRAQFGRPADGLAALRAISPVLAREPIRWHTVSSTGVIVVKPGSGCTV